MKVLYFLAHPNSIGGAAKVMLKQAQLMKNLGCGVEVVIQNDNNNKHVIEYNELCDEYGLHYIEGMYSIAICMEEIDINQSVLDYSNVRQIISDYNPDIIHSLQLNISVEMVARELNIPHVMSIYPMSDQMANIKWIDIYPKYQTADSQFYCDKWSSGLKIISRCIRVPYSIPNNILCSDRRKNKIELISIGVFAEYKNQLNIIKFIEQCVKKGHSVNIVFLGDYNTKYGKECLQYVKTHNLEGFIKFEGFVSNIEDYLKDKDLLIHASEKESYPGVLVEAIANRIPVIIRNTGGISELIKNEYNGFLMPDSEVDTIEKFYNRYMACSESDELNEIINNAYNTYLENHTYEKIAEKLYSYYKEIISSDNSRINYLNINDIEKIFIKKDYAYDFTKRHSYYLEHMKSVFQNNHLKQVLVWGAGKYGQVAIEWCEILGANLIGYIDSSKEGEYCDMPIYKKDDDLVKSVDAILVAVGDFTACQEICGFLEHTGRIRNVDYFLMQNNSCL